MGREFSALIAAIWLITPLAAAQAQSHGADCPAGPTSLPSELSAWSSRRPLAAATSTSETGGSTIIIGAAVDTTLRPTADVQYIVGPTKPGVPTTYGGLLAFAINKPGTYRVALGSAAWVDVLRGTTSVTSTAHSHGPDCSGIRKMVDFPLTAGRYTLQIAGNDQASTTVLIVQVP